MSLTSGSTQLTSSSTPSNPTWFIDTNDIPKTKRSYHRKSTTASSSSRQKSSKSTSDKTSSSVENEVRKLIQINKELVKENSRLRQQITRIQKMSNSCKV